MDISPSYQSYTYLYTRVWLASSVLMISLRFFGIPPTLLVSILMAYIGVSWLAIAGISIYEGQRLATYVNKHLPHLIKRGRYGFGLSGLSGWRLLGLADPIKQSNDPIALWLVENLKNIITLQVLVFISYPILLVITMLGRQ
jgi:hypothetical protein